MFDPNDKWILYPFIVFVGSLFAIAFISTIG